MNVEFYMEEAINLYEGILHALKRDFEEGKFLIYQIELYNDYTEVLYTDDRDFDNINIKMGITVITERGENWLVIQDFNVTKGDEDFVEDHIQVLLEGMKNSMERNLGYATLVDGEFRMATISDKDLSLSFTLSPDAFCGGIVSDSIRGNDTGEGARTPIVLDDYKTTGLNNLGELFNQVKDVSVWNEYRLTAVIRGIRGEYRIGQTTLKLVYEKNGVEDSINMKVPFILQRNEDKASSSKQGWQEYIESYFNS